MDHTYDYYSRKGCRFLYRVDRQTGKIEYRDKHNGTWWDSYFTTIELTEDGFKPACRNERRAMGVFH